MRSPSQVGTLLGWAEIGLWAKFKLLIPLRFFQKPGHLFSFGTSGRESHYPCLHPFPKKEQFTEGAKGNL